MKAGQGFKLVASIATIMILVAIVFLEASSGISRGVVLQSEFLRRKYHCGFHLATRTRTSSGSD
eukprot:scaffold58033_cov22-Prasinocladus_malaysianus.AAC.1